MGQDGLPEPPAVREQIGVVVSDQTFRQSALPYRRKDGNHKWTRMDTNGRPLEIEALIGDECWE